ANNFSEVYSEKYNFSLFKNYPNPFNPSTTIEYYLPKSGKVTIKIFDSLGKEIETLVNEHKQAGHYQVIFNARNLPSGVYYYSLISGSTIITKSMVLIK
ncbi:T9SS type A sorting domain-containing protein, partial [Melioribacter sp. OK-6-Me]